MKKALALALIAFFIMLSPLKVIAQEITIPPQDRDATTSVQKKVEYTLVYPGMLPDNPLYFLKTVRDRIVSVLINDPLKKTEFNLLTSDKRIYAAKLLMDRGKNELAVSTLSKSNNYLLDAVESVKKAKTEGKNTDSILHNISLSTRKHEEMVNDFLKSAGKEFNQRINYERLRLAELENSVNKLLPR